MDILDILREAKNPSSKSRTIQVGQTENDTDDYTNELDDESDVEDTEELDGVTDTEDDTTEDPDYTEEVDEPEEDDQNQDEPTDTSEDTDDTEDEQVDYTEDIDGADDGGTDDTTDDQSSSDTTDENTDLSPEEKDELKKNALLIKNCINLYYSIKTVENKLGNISNASIVTNKINIQVKKNLSVTLDQLYDLITVSFINNTYTKNLYLYTSFIEAYKINIEMLRKNNQFQ